jgi:hypothetical protein
MINAYMLYQLFTWVFLDPHRIAVLIYGYVFIRHWGILSHGTPLR